MLSTARRYHILLFISLTVVSSFSRGQVKCAEVFSELNAVPRPISQILLSESINPFVSSADQVVHFDGAQTLQSGQKLNYLKSENGTWGSSFSGNGVDVMGNPLWFSAIVGPEVAAKFGFMEISNQLITAPTVSYLNGAITKANKALAKKSAGPLAISFYETTANSPITGKAYLENFVNGKLPIEKMGALGIHDLSYHVSSLLLPKWFFQRLQSSTVWVLKFTRYLEVQRSLEHHSEAEYVLSNTARNIDLVGNFTSYFAEDAIDPKYNAARAAIYNLNGKKWNLGALVSDCGANLSPIDFLKSVLSDNPMGLYHLNEFLRTDEGSVLLSLSPSLSSSALGAKLRDDLHATIKNLE